jgi:hypothetical protein
MRNVFDQFKEPENRLTHALMTSLSEEPDLLRRFVIWAAGPGAPRGRLNVQEQSLPGECEEAEENGEAERRGLPDGCIHDGESFALAIESKIASPLEMNQLRRHRSTIERLGFTDVRLLALVVTEPARCAVEGLTLKTWTELYQWLCSQKQSDWVKRLRSYMEVLEAKLPKEQYLKEGTLTVFSGIPFGKGTPYNYLEAKRILRLLMDALRTNKLLKKELGVDPSAEGRGAITGRDSDAVWDYLPIGAAAGATTFTQYPHLTVGVHADFVQALVIVPNGVRTSFRRALVDGGQEGFCELFRSTLGRYRDVIGNEAGVSPVVEAVQRRYPSQRSEPFIDARIDFDLRTAFDDRFGSETPPKRQPQWLVAVFEALSQKRSNLQLAVGARFDYDLCSLTQSPAITQRIAECWVAFKPIVDKMLSRGTYIHNRPA